MLHEKQHFFTLEKDQRDLERRNINKKLVSSMHFIVFHPDRYFPNLRCSETVMERTHLWFGLAIGLATSNTIR